MALFKTRGAAIYGIDAHLIDVEVDMFASGNARDSVMVGMPDVAVRESRERIKSALINSGFGYPNKRITINLAPANVRKEGAGFDLPVAIGILGAMGAVKALDQHIFIGELSLDGAVRGVRGALSVAVCARDLGIPNLIVPYENAAEAAVAAGKAFNRLGQPTTTFDRSRLDVDMRYDSHSFGAKRRYEDTELGGSGPERSPGALFRPAPWRTGQAVA